MKEAYPAVYKELLVDQHATTKDGPKKHISDDRNTFELYI